MKSVVITGVSSGIGFSGADILCQAGYRVYGSVRKEETATPLLIKHPNNFIPLK